MIHKLRQVVLVFAASGPIAIAMAAAAETLAVAANFDLLVQGQASAVTTGKTNAEDDSSLSPSVADKGSDVVWRSSRVCGLNCLYLLMRVHGYQPDYHDMQSNLLGEELTDFTDMQDYAAQNDFKLRAARMAKADLMGYGAPLIAHFDKVRADGVGYGHFVLVTDVHDGVVRYIDGTTVVSGQKRLSEFQRDWSGYVLHPAKPAQASPIYKTEIVAFVAGILVGCVAHFSSRLIDHRRVSTE